MYSQSLMEGLRLGKFTTKMKSGNYYVPVTLFTEVGRIFFQFSYSAPLIAAIKDQLEGRKWHGFVDGDNRKLWSCPISFRNLFRITSLMGRFSDVDPYTYWSAKTEEKEAEVITYCQSRNIKPYKHQIQLIAAILTYHWYIGAADMGTGKTLSAIVAIEMFKPMGKILWVGPKSALVAAKAEFRLWRTSINPTFSTYDSLKNIPDTWREAPQVLILDEASRVKTPTAQRTVAAAHIANAIRKEWGWDKSLIIELSGSPAPKTPVDWWSLTEIACPGFITEGNTFAMRDRLACVIDQEQFEGGGSFKKVKTWWDDEKKCKTCGEVENHPNHLGSSFETALFNAPDYEIHAFKASVNEVAKLSQRMTGLVGVWKKEDCLDLPPKRYELHELTPTVEMMNAARLIVDTTTRAADALIRLRTLSDGFLYQKTPTGETIQCPGCKGCGKITEYFDSAEPEVLLTEGEIEERVRYVYEDCPENEDPVLFTPEIVERRGIELNTRFITCYTCEGKGVVPVYERTVQEVVCPKYPLLEDLLEQHEEDGRFVTYAGFTGSIARTVRVCLQKGWTTLKCDGQGWIATHPSEGALDWKAEEMVYQFQNGQAAWPKMVFVGQPSSAGMGLTLTASPSIYYLSNDFNPESRIQSEDRIHRIGMGLAGGRIIDCIHLPSDRKVIQALLKARSLQSMSMEGLRAMYR
jgi:hypothetical protein